MASQWDTNEPFEGVHRPIKRRPRFLNRKEKGIRRKGFDQHMRDRYAKSRGDPRPMTWI